MDRLESGITELREGFVSFSKDIKAMLDRMDAKVEVNSRNIDRLIDRSALQDERVNRIVAVVEQLEQRIDDLESPKDTENHGVVSETVATQTAGIAAPFEAEESRIKPPSADGSDANSDDHLDHQRQLDMSALVLQKLEDFERQLHNVADRNDRVGGQRESKRRKSIIDVVTEAQRLQRDTITLVQRDKSYLTHCKWTNYNIDAFLMWMNAIAKWESEPTQFIESIFPLIDAKIASNVAAWLMRYYPSVYDSEQSCIRADRIHIINVFMRDQTPRDSIHFCKKLFTACKNYKVIIRRRENFKQVQTDTEVLKIRFRERYEFLHSACSQFARTDPNRVPEITMKTGGLLEVWMQLIPEENVQPYKRLLRKERFSSLDEFFTDYMKLVDNTLQLNESAIAFQYAFAAPRRAGASVSFLDQYPDDEDDPLVADSTAIMADDDNYSAIDDDASINELGKTPYSAKSSDFSRPKVCDKLLFGHNCPGPPTCRFEHGKAAISAARQWYLDKLQTDPKASQPPWSSSKSVADSAHRGSVSSYRQNPGVQSPWKKHGDVSILSTNKTEPLVVEEEMVSSGGTRMSDSQV